MNTDRQGRRLSGATAEAGAHFDEALAHERLALKPHSPINRAFLRRSRSAADERSASRPS